MSNYTLFDCIYLCSTEYTLPGIQQAVQLVILIRVAGGGILRVKIPDTTTQYKFIEKTTFALLTFKAPF
ncbi:MAG: hypothetical protein IM571_09510 [Chitinophagaceae bacterium]|jgi:hypothetical protein|nr:hypothetical protein [Chitinophagaceae bacterium]MCA6478176.1 hypothetical protein [Chitinophagaceae bacterium]MCA6480843.1 hypothetical protein [Chitinophagaceae bacterium]MCA6484679.1 hypothetical protein [Chitinophagaceae bacterium]MCA6516913.1 hypothetical protein [Chitinophagaceae bacterium]